jgi:hypothetical protein
MNQERYRELVNRKAEKLTARGPMRLGATEVVATPPRRPATEAMASGRMVAEAIIKWYRPVLVITEDRFVRSPEHPTGDPRFVDPDTAASADLLAALETNRARLDVAIPSVGRIELTNNASYPWVGTGWLIGSDLGNDIIVTNAHVAREFGMQSGGRMIFRPGMPDFAKRQSATIDFREELGAAQPREFPITDILWISEDGAIDMALLRVARTAGADKIGAPIALAAGDTIDPSRMLAVVGYPGSGGGYDPEPFHALFGKELGKKRFSPGLFEGGRSGFMTYDASTLPGSSGSVVLDVETGTGLGLHFAGSAFETNYAVTSPTLRRVLRDQPWKTEAVTARRPVLGDNRAGTGAQMGTGAPAGQGAPDELRFVVPFEFTVRLGQSYTVAPSSAAIAPRTGTAAPEAAAERVRAYVGQNPAVLSVAASYLFRGGEITDELGVIVGVRPGASLDPAAYGLGTSVDGVPVSVEPAGPETVATREFGMILEAFDQRRAQYVRDLTDPRFDLSPVTGPMRMVLHVSPESGWTVLKGFLARNNAEQFTVGMYHMTAPHVVAAIKQIADRNQSGITLTIDRQKGQGARPDDTTGDTKVNDIPERTTLDELEAIAGNRFKWAPASLGAQGLFATSYHIKVAVWTDRLPGNNRKDLSFWLSSGNWQSSNQAPIEKAPDAVTWDDVKAYNREWHALVEHEGLAATFRNHLEQDFEDCKAAAAEEALPGPAFDVLVPEEFLELPRRPTQFRAFEPLVLEDTLKVQPLLTPDNYPEIIRGLIAGATERVLIENQSFAFWQDVASMPDHFVAILEAIRERQEAGLDVRVIFRSGFGKERDVLRQMKAFGLKADAQHVRYFDTCHTKGMVIDRNIAVLGSQNLTAAGTGPNRDASLVIWHERANDYFAELFEYDWRQVAENRIRVETPTRESIRLIQADLEAPTPAGFRRISLAEYLGET